jgi:hypothetical protein
LYGDDVFDQNNVDGRNNGGWSKKFSKAKWGELQANVEEEEEEEEEEAEEDSAATAKEKKRLEEIAAAARAVHESSGDDMVESDDEDDDFDVEKEVAVEKPKQLYTVLHQQSTTATGSASAGVNSNFVGSSHVYSGIDGTNTSASNTNYGGNSSTTAVVANNAADEDQDEEEDDDANFKF